MISEKTRKEFNQQFHLLSATAAQAGMRFNKNEFAYSESSLKSTISIAKSLLADLKPLVKKYGGNPLLNGARKKARRKKRRVTKRSKAISGITSWKKNFRYKLISE